MRSREEGGDVDWKIRRALLSVSDKTGVVELAQALHAHGCELISTGGTGKALVDAGLPVTEISTVTGNPEAFGGRMKTISFAIESALLFDRERDQEEAAGLGIAPIDMVVCNLYPFAKHRDAGAEMDGLIEQIDIGGPTMIRAAAKNYRYVAAVCRAADYGSLIEELQEREGALSLATRQSLMRTAFNHTADYDAMIAETMDDRLGVRSLRLSFTDGVTLRYGENAHQTGAFLRGDGAGPSLFGMEVLGGKPLSYNNIVDIHGAVEAVRDLERFGCSVIKHTNPCGLSEADDQRAGFEHAWAGDPVSAFGSVIAFNRPVSKKAVEFLGLENQDRAQRKFVEVVIAPDFEAEAVDYLKQHESLRIIRFDPKNLDDQQDVKVFGNSCLVQDSDRQLYERLEAISERVPEGGLAPGDKLHDLICFGLKAVRQVKSNAIVLVQRREDGTHQLLGMGAGQPNRVISTKLAVDRATATLRNEGLDDNAIRIALGRAVLISGAFFPFPDSVETAAAAGVKTFVQPAGSIRDDLVVGRCDELGLAMVATGMRHFKH